MKRKLFIILALAALLCLLCCSSALAYESGTCGENVNWTLTAGLLTISGSGEMTNYTTAADAPWFNYRTSITSVAIYQGVTSIGDRAFYSCSKLTDVRIPDSVVSLGDYAFCFCSSLESIAIPDGVTRIGEHAFTLCTSLTDVTIPNSVTSFGDYAFNRCSGLRSFTIPNSVTSIGGYAFICCTGLTEITIPDSVESIGHRVFNNCTNLSSVTFLSGTTVIGTLDYDVFLDCPSNLTIYGLTGSTAETYARVARINFSALLDGVCGDDLTWTLNEASGTLTISGTGAMTNYAGGSAAPWYNYRASIAEIVIYQGVTSICGGAFIGYENLTDVTIPGSVLSVGDSAFYGCASLTGVTIQNGVASLGNYAFLGCASLTDIAIPASVISIGSSIFFNCASLRGIHVDGANTVYSSMDGILFNKEKTVLITCPPGFSEPSCVIPDGVVSLGDYAFNGCSGLTAITFPASVTSIGMYAFQSCVNLEDMYYDGTQAEWAASVTIGVGNDRLTGATFHCTNPDAVVASGSCGENLAWQLTNAGVLTISGTGAMWDYNYTDNISPFRGDAGITSLIVDEGVTRVGSYFMWQCANLASVSLPDGLLSIGNGAFSHCGLTDVDLPDTVTSIGMDAFSGSAGITALTIPAGMTVIGRQAFNNMTGLTSVTIHDGVRTIGHTAFSQCSSLVEITIPESVTDLSYGAFANCSALTDVTICGDSVTFGTNVFLRCAAGLTLHGYAGSTVETYAQTADIPFVALPPKPAFFLPADLTAIEGEAFAGIDAQAVVIPNAVTSIASDAFAGSQVTAIYGYAGSAAEAFCASHPEFTFVEIDDAWLAAH